MARMDGVEDVLDFTKDKLKQRAHDEILLEALNHVNQNDDGQQYVLRTLATVFNYWLNIPAAQVNSILQIARTVRNSFSLINDLENNSCERRRSPFAHSIYGVATTINAANYGYFLALEMANDLGHSNALNVITELMRQLHRAQELQNSWRKTSIQPTESEYKQLIVQEIGNLFSLIPNLMQLFSDKKYDFTKLNAMLAVYVQIHVECSNLTDENLLNPDGIQKSSIGLIGASYSFLNSYALDHAPAGVPRQTLVANLRKSSYDADTRKRHNKLLKQLNAFNYTRNYLESLYEQIQSEAAKFGINPHLDAWLNEFRAVLTDTMICFLH